MKQRNNLEQGAQKNLLLTYFDGIKSKFIKIKLKILDLNSWEDCTERDMAEEEGRLFTFQFNTECVKKKKSGFPLSLCKILAHPVLLRMGWRVSENWMVRVGC